MSRRFIAFALAFAVAGGSSVHVLGQAAAPAAPAAEAQPERYADPVVQALMDTKPEKPEDLLTVILLLLDLNQPKPAKFLFTKLMAIELDEPQLVALGKKIGAGGLFRIGQTPEFRPDGATFAAKTKAAMDRAARDPERIAELIERLKEPSVDARVAAIAELRQGFEQAAGALLGVLYDPARAEEHANVRAALATLGVDGVEPLGLIGTFADDQNRAAALSALAQTDAPEAKAPLYAAAFGSRSSSLVKQVASQAIVRRAGRLPAPIDAAAELYLDAKRLYLSPTRDADLAFVQRQWIWDAKQKRPTLVTTTRKRIVALTRAALLAEIAADISGRDRDAVTLSQAASLEAAVLTPPPQAEAAPAAAAPADGAEPPATDTSAAAAPQQPDVVGQWNVDHKPTAVELHRLLEFTAAHDRVAPAAAVIRLVVKAEGLRVVEGVGGRPALMVRLMTHPNRRIRFAALEAIVGLNPQEPFTGSSAVADALGYFAAATGTHKVVVADVNSARARDIGGIAVGGSGGSSAVATTARDAIRLVSADPDVETVLMYRTMMLAEMGQLLAQIRADYRTARLPVFVYCEPNDVERTRSLILSDPYSFAIYQPRSVQMLQQQTDPSAMTQAARAFTPAPERTDQANFALESIADLLATNNKTFNLRPYEAAYLSAAWNAPTNSAAIKVLTAFGSPSAQRTLVDLASAQTWPIEVRKAAGAGFGLSVKRFGLLLTTAEISRQYDRYNASATTDKETQGVLGATLDVIEKRDATTAAAPGAVKIAPAAVNPPAAPANETPPTQAVPKDAASPEAPPKGAAPGTP
jgi:hypothetical protein